MCFSLTHMLYRILLLTSYIYLTEGVYELCTFLFIHKRLVTRALFSISFKRRFSNAFAAYGN